MFILLPVVLLIFAVVAILILNQVRPGVGASWLVAVAAALAAWVAVLAFRFIPPNPVPITDIAPLPGISLPLIFQIDDFSWPYAFGLLSLFLAVILTAPVRFSSSLSISQWLGSMIIISAAYLAVTSGTILTLIISWMLIDLIELIVLLTAVKKEEFVRKGIIQLSVRVVGTLMAVWGLLVSSLQGQGGGLANLLSETGLFLLLAVVLRLGVVPINLSYGDDPQMRRGLATVLRVAGPVSSLAILSRLPAAVAPPQIAIYLLIFTTFAFLFGSIMWLTSQNELSGRPYFLISIGSMATASAIRGRPVAALAWGCVLVFMGGFLFLNQANNRFLRVIFVLLFVSMTGLPFTPAASGWQGLVVLPFNLLDIVSIGSFALLLLGTFRRGWDLQKELQDKERWAQLVYQVGLLILFSSFWLTGLFGWKGSFTIGNLQASVGAAILTAVLIFLEFRFRVSQNFSRPASSWYLVLIKKMGAVLSKIISMDWIYPLINSVFNFFQRLITAFTVILEGEGGVLWALVLLVLLISLLRQRGEVP
jgi:hypothetical protein